MDITRRRMLMLLPAAAVAWKYVQAGTPEASPNYKLTEHWWAMLIDIPKCIGLPLQLHLGHPERSLEMYLTPHRSSAMAMFGFVYLWYLMAVLLLEIWLDLPRLTRSTQTEKP